MIALSMASKDGRGLILLDDESPMVERLYAVEVKAVDEKTRTATFIASTEAIDAYDEIVEQDWILDHFKANPVILWGHQSRELPIGRALRCEVVNDIRGPHLECDIEFCTEEMNPLAERVFKMVRAKFLRAVSVGFRPKSVRYEKRDDKEVYVLSRNVLKEISVVTIPANHEALAKGGDPLAKIKALAFEAAQKNTAPAEGGEPTAAKESPEPITPAGDDARGQEITDMKTLEEALKALDAANEKIATLDVQAGAHAKAVADMEARAKAAEETVEALRSGIKVLSEESVAVGKALGAPKAKLDEKGEPMKTEKGDVIYETLPEQAERLVGELIARDVDALVGVKIEPHQKDTFVAMAKKDRSMFDEVVKGLSPLKVLGAVMTADKPEPSSVSASEDGGEFADEVQRSIDGENVSSDEGDFGDELADDDDVE